MNGFSQAYAASSNVNTNPSGPVHHQSRRSTDGAASVNNGRGRIQSQGNGSTLPMPVRSTQYGGGGGGAAGAAAAAGGGGGGGGGAGGGGGNTGMPADAGNGAMPSPFPGPRSPPKNKNTAHVPCKFFLQGQCQAGRTCPFSHDPDSTMRPAPCKYFAKGGCKFGRKCALLHITPDGNVVNRGGGGGFMMPPPPTQHQALFPAMAQNGAYSHPPPPGLLSQGLEHRPNGEGAADEYQNYQHLLRNGYDAPDMMYTSASPQYGSPPSNDRFASSPPAKGLSVLDAPLPGSFDSQGISMAARNGPFASSVPSRFGLESPPSSLPHKAQLGNTALRDLHSSAFGNNGLDHRLAGLGSSPPSGTDEPLTFPKRPLHSERLRVSGPMVSASLGTGGFPTRSFEYSDDEDDGGDTDREEDCLPASLHDLIPEARSRKDSRIIRHEVMDDTPAAFLASQRRTISGHATPSDSKVGSPHASSPSRYSGTFARMSYASKDMGGDISTYPFPTVGSPLRNESSSSSSFFSPVATGSRSGHPGDMSPGVASPPRQASMSMLTQELQRTRIDAARAASSVHQPSGSLFHGGGVSYAKAAAAGNSAVPGAAKRTNYLDRTSSTSNIGRERIEEEEVFSMDDTGK